MMTRTARLALGFVVLLGGLPRGAGAQGYLLRTYTEQDGLPNNKVRDLAQDASGRMWFLVWAGVVVYDGDRWMLPRTSPETSLPENFSRIAADSEGGVWAVTGAIPFELAHYDGQEWRAVPPPAFDSLDRGGVTSIAVMSNADGPGAVAVGTTNRGLYVRSGSSWKHFTTHNGLPDMDVHCLAEHGGRIVIAGKGGLCSLRGETLEGSLSDLLPESRRNIVAIAQERTLRKDETATDRLWVVGPDWVGMVTEGGFESVTDQIGPIDLAHPEEVVAEVDGNGGLFIAGRLGIIHVDRGSGRVISLGQANGLPGEGASGLRLDHEANLWIATGRGVVKLISMRFANYRRDQGLLEDEVTAIKLRASGELVFGHNNGLSRLVGDGFLTMPLKRPGLPEAVYRRVLDLDEDSAGNLWAACSNSGLARIDPLGSVRWYACGSSESDSVNCVRVDHEGGIWVAGSCGLLRLSRDRLETVPMGDAPRVTVRRIVFDAADTLYAATSGGGVDVRENGRWHRYMSQEGAAANDVFAILPSRDGKVWVGTKAGLFELADPGLRRPTIPSLILRRPVYFVMEDREARMWIGTDYGVYRWDGRLLRHYTAREGLAGQETNRAAGITDSAGRVWIGTDGGVSRYQEEFERPPDLAPLLRLVTFEAGGIGEIPVGTAELEITGESLFIHANAASYIDENQIQYRSKLEGFDPEWITRTVSTHFETRYTSLPRGSYRFLLQAIGPEGVASPIISSGQISVPGPIWLRPWFLSVLLAVFVCAAYAGQHYVSQRRYSRKLEADVHERTAELAASREEIASERARLAATLNSIGDGVIAVDSHANVVLVNPAAEALIGRTAADALGQPMRDVMKLLSETAAGEVDPASDVLRLEKPATIFALTLEAPHRQFAIELTGAPVRTGDGAMAGAVIAFRDITQRKRADEEIAKARRLEALGLLAGGIAHDFNNILTVILGNVSLARAGVGPGDNARARLEEAEKALKRAHDLSQQLLAFSKGGLPVTGAASIADLVRESSRFVLSGSKVLCALHLADNLWPVEVDSGQVNQVLNNILINALQAMPAGGSVEISASNEEPFTAVLPDLPPGRYVRVVLRDTGTGIPADLLPRIFDPYFTTKQQGSGLGLATVYSVMRNHRGGVTVESTPGHGTAFSLYFPASDKNLISAKQEALLPPSSGRGRVLIMDDEEPVRKVLAEMLTHLGFEPFCTSRGEEAVAVYLREADRGHPFHIAFLDLTVPGGMGGKEVVRTLRELDPEVKAVASSGYSNDPVMARHADSGFCAVLPKPYRLSDLEKVVAEVLG
ncbi:MAG: PAS domain-containing protein [Acidobacteria bacterium]|nr:PAS domain-containing protein [Acidobacteriota bacterium]